MYCLLFLFFIFAQIYLMNQIQLKTQNQVVKSKSKKENPFLMNKELNNTPNLKASWEQRFNHRNTQNLGQVNYNLSTKPESRFQDIMQSNKEYLWITDKGRQLFQTKSFWKNNLGPGKYPSLYPTQRHHSNWPKSKRFNYEKTQISTLVGPGWYQTKNNDDLKQKSIAASAFKSKKTKNYLDDKINELRKNQQMNVNPQESFQPIETQNYFENENHYQRFQSHKKRNASPVFVSKCERLPTIQASNIGPGSYIVQKEQKKTPKIVKRIQTEPGNQVSKENLIIKQKSSKHIRRFESYFKEEDLQSKRKAILGVIMKEKRFKQQSTNNPGPGDYQVTRKIAKTQKNVSYVKFNEKLRGSNRLIGSLVRKALVRNRQINKSQSHMNIFKQFRSFQKEKEIFQDAHQNK